MKKLTDVQLSKILGMASINKLDHNYYYDSERGTNCIAGAAFNLGPEGFTEYHNPNKQEIRILEISRVIEPVIDNYTSFYIAYPKGPDNILRYIEERGLA